VALDRLAVAEVDGQPAGGFLHLRALLLEVEVDPALAELLRELLRGVFVLGRDQPRQHLDDRHLGAEAPEDRRELAADDAAAQDDEPLRHLGLREQRLGVDAAWRVEAVDRRPERKRAGRDDRRLEGDVFAPFERDRVGVPEAAGALDPLDAVGLEEAGDALRHLVDDLRFPFIRRREIEARSADLDAELGEGVLCLFNRERGLNPRFRWNAADTEARATELGLLLDTHRPGAELTRPDRGGVAARASAENCDVAFHRAESYSGSRC